MRYLPVWGVLSLAAQAFAAEWSTLDLFRSATLEPVVDCLTVGA